MLALDAFAEETQPPMQVLGSGLRIHAAVNETYEIGKMVIAKQSGDGRTRDLHAPRLVQTICIGGQAAAIAEKPHI